MASKLLHLAVDEVEYRHLLHHFILGNADVIGSRVREDLRVDFSLLFDDLMERRSLKLV